MKNNKDISVVILSYNTREITDNCLAFVKKAQAYSHRVLKNKVDIILVDNNSSDGTIEMIQSKYKDVLLLAQKENLGVTRGYNLGMKKATTPYILIINSDTYIEEKTLVQCLEYLMTNKKCDVVMARLTDAKGNFHPYAGHLPTPFRTIRWLLGLENVPLLKTHIKRIYQYNPQYYLTPAVIEWAPSCFYFMRREVYDKTGGQDEKMFFYMDDVEWSKRIYDLGMRIWFVGSIGSVHLGGESTSKKSPIYKMLSRQVEGFRYYHRKHSPKYYFWINLALYMGYGARSIFYFTTGQVEKANAYLRVLPERNRL
jgi:GT2 family glycosyltransferase